MTLKDTLEKKLIEINQAIDIHVNEYTSVGLLTGIPGVILFKFYYAKYRDDEQYAEEAYELIHECFEKFNTHKLLLTYCDGVAGFGWALDHLVQNDLLEADIDMLLSDLENILYDKMVEDLENEDYDFFHGAMGYAIYFLGRYKNTTSTDSKKRYADYLHYFIDKVVDFSINNEDGFRTWISIIDPKTKEKAYNLSLSHGVTSILGFFTRLAEFDEFRKKCEPIMKDVIAYISSTEILEPVCFFPSYIHLDGTIPEANRLAWCYGDLGVGLQFWHAAKVLNDDTLYGRALEILRKTVERRSMDDTRVVDASICHGSFGIAHIFHKFFRELKDPIYESAAEFWLQDGLDRAFHKDGFAGYKQVQANGWENEIGLLEGISGIGLVIIDYLSEEPNTWDEAFMIS